MAKACDLIQRSTLNGFVQMKGKLSSGPICPVKTGVFASAIPSLCYRHSSPNIHPFVLFGIPGPEVQYLRFGVGWNRLADDGAVENVSGVAV